MKNKSVITALICTSTALSACSGDRTPQNGKDSVDNRYQVSKDTSKIDTGKIVSSDNSASGGTKITQDTAKPAAQKK